MAVSIIGPKFYAWDSDTGKPLAFGKVYTYQAGTNTPKPTFTSESGETQNANPVILNGAGYADIYLTGSYKVVLKDADDVEVWTSDPVSDASSSLRPWINEQEAVQVSPKKFKVTGNKTDIFRYGSSVKLDDTVIFYATVISSEYLSGETFVTIQAVDAITNNLKRVYSSLVTIESLLPVLTTEASETLINGVTASLATFEERMQIRFANFLAESGYQFIGNYADGIEITEYNQVVRDTSGEFWRVSGSTALPYTTTGAGLPEGGAFVYAGDAVLRQDLINGTLKEKQNFRIDVNNVADLKSETSIYEGALVSTLGYISEEIGGANDYEIVAGGTGVADGGSYIDLDNGLQAKALFPGNIYDSRQWGATGTGDESAIYQAAVDYLIANGLYFLEVNVDHDTNLTINNRSNVVFRGRGSFLHTNRDNGNYRRPVVPENAGFATAFPDPTMKLKLDAVKRTVKIVIAGDSLATYGSNSLSPIDTLIQMFVDKVTNDNPETDFEFVGRSIGGQGFRELDTVPSTSFPITDGYPWYTDPNRPWMDYIADENPDFVFLATGIDDWDLSISAFESVISKVEALGAKPILMSSMGVNLSPIDSFQQGFGSFTAQEGKDAAAGFMRTYAWFNNYPLIDMNRTFNLVRDGRDVLSTYLVPKDEITFATPSKYQAFDWERCRDFSIEATIDPAGWTNANPILVQLSAQTGGRVLIDDDAGFLRFRFYAGVQTGSTSAHLVETSDIPTPTASEDIEIAVRGGQFSFRVRSYAGISAGQQPYTRQIIRWGGLLTPRITYEADLTNGPVIKARLYVGVEELYIPAITDVEMFGIITDTVKEDPERGGNGLNHPATRGAMEVYGRHFAANDYHFEKGVEIIENGQGRCYLYPDGRQECEAVLDAIGGATTAQGALFVGSQITWNYANPFVDNTVFPFGSGGKATFEPMFTAGSPAAIGVVPRCTFNDPADATLRVKASGRWK